MITDFHSHILPAFDDGAENAKTSIEMLKISKNMGVDTVISTSHCYPGRSSDVEEFLIKRENAFEELKSAMKECSDPLPDIKLGCELHLTGDITRLRDYKKLCIDDTNYMLLEMPSSKWTDRTIDYVYKLTINGIKPIIAHQERNIEQNAELLSALYQLDILIQINNESFGFSPMKKLIDKLLKNKMLHIVGSDMHNMKSRKPNMNRSQKYITKRYGIACWDYLMNNAELILSGEELAYRDMKAFSKKTLFAKK